MGIDANSVLGDVVDGQILYWRYLGFWGIHTAVEQPLLTLLRRSRRMSDIECV